MASNGNDPTTGHPLFPATDAPDMGVDEEILAAYAAFRGTRMYGTNAEMEAFESAGYARFGELWMNTTDSKVYGYDGGWVSAGSWLDEMATLTAAAGITLTHRVSRIGNLISFDVSASKATDMGANETVTTLPADFRPVNNITGGLHLSSALTVIAAFGSILDTGEVRVNALGAAGVRNVFFNLTWVRDS